jgi:hypothetical protein
LPDTIICIIHKDGWNIQPSYMDAHAANFDHIFKEIKENAG